MPRLALLLSMLAASAAAQVEVDAGDGLSARLAGTVQPRVSAAVQDTAATGGQERFGFGLRRVRFEARVVWRDRVGFEFDVDGSSGAVTPVDMYGVVFVTDRLQVRAGRVPGAQPRGSVATSHREIDAVERAAIVGRWADGTLGSSGRDIGVDVRYDAGGTFAELFVHDGSGVFTRDEANFRQAIEDPSATGGVGRAGLAVSAALRHQPAALAGVEVGGYASANAGGNERTEVDGVRRSYVSAGGFAYWGAEPGSQPLRLKLDALATAYESVPGLGQRASVGVSVLGAARVLGAGEAFVRPERFWPDAGPAETYLTAGASYSLSAAAGGRYRAARLTAAYAWRDAGGLAAHLAVVQGQFAF